MRHPRRAVLGAILLITSGCSAGGGGGSDWLDHLPEAVLGGGGGQLSLEVRSNRPALLRASFSTYGGDSDGVGAEVPLSPGARLFRVQVPSDAYIYLELAAPDAEPGATLAWNLDVDGQRVWQDEDRLDEPLEPGHAFFLQIEAEDLDDLKARAAS